MTIEPTIPQGFQPLADQPFWHVAINKIPQVSWTDRSNLTTYRKAVEIRDRMIANGDNAVLMFVLRYTNYRVLDLDPDKTTGLLRESQQRVLTYYADRTLITESSSGVGRHIWLIDPYVDPSEETPDERRLPKIGSDKVKSGEIPFEIKHDVIFEPVVVAADRHIAVADATLFRRVASFRGQPELPKPKDPRIVPRTAESDEIDQRISSEIIGAYRAAGVPLCPNNERFQQVMFALKATGRTNHEIVAILREEDGWDNDAPRRIKSARSDVRQILNLIKLAKTDNVVPKGKRYDLGLVTNTDKPKPKPTTKPNRTEVDKELGKIGGFRFCLERLGVEIRYNELTDIEIRYGDKDWQELNDELFSDIYINHIIGKFGRWVATKTGKEWRPFEVGADVRREVMFALGHAGKPFNPTREWLHTLTPKEDISAIDEYLKCYEIDGYGRLKDHGIEPDKILAYYREGFTLMMAGWVMRSLTPGVLIDKFPVLIGDKGCGKGLGLQLQLPPAGVNPVNGKITPNAGFRDQCRLSDDRAAWYHNRKCSLGEVTELVGFSDPKNEAIKAFVSATHDHQEMKYKNYATSIPKSYFHVGTTNKLDFKPADGDGDRRMYVMDLSYGFEGDGAVTSREIPKVLTDDWRKRAVGHILWRIEQGYRADIEDWQHVEDIREFMVGQSSKRYPRIEQALIAIATGTVDCHMKEFVPNSSPIERLKPEWEFYNYEDLAGYHIKENKGIIGLGLPFDNPGLASRHPTWMRLLALHDKGLVDRYPARKIKLVALEHLRWHWWDRRTAHSIPRCRGWLQPMIHGAKQLRPEPDPDHDS